MKTYEEEWNAEDLFTDGGEPTDGPDGDGGNKAESGGDLAATGTPGQGEVSVKTEPEQDMVPKSALIAERNTRQAAETNLHNLTNHLQNMQLGTKKTEEAVDLLSNLNPDTVMTFAEVKQYVGAIEKKFSDQLSSATTRNTGLVSELNVKAEHSDYNDVISTNLLNVLSVNPQMKQALASASDEFRPLLAYTIGKMDPAYVKQKAGETADVIAERIKKQAAMPGSVNAASGSGAETDLSKVIDNLSSEAFEARIARVKATADA